MPFDEAAVGNATGGVKGTLNKRLGPLPVWAWAGGVVGGIGVFLLFKHFQSGTSASASVPAVSSQTSGPGVGGSGSSGSSGASDGGSQNSGPAGTQTNPPDNGGSGNANLPPPPPASGGDQSPPPPGWGIPPGVTLPAGAPSPGDSYWAGFQQAIRAGLIDPASSFSDYLSGHAKPGPFYSGSASGLSPTPNTATTTQSAPAAPTGQQVATTTPAADPFAGFEAIYTQQQAAGVNEQGAPNPYTAAAQAGY